MIKDERDELQAVIDSRLLTKRVHPEDLSTTAELESLFKVPPIFKISQVIQLNQDNLKPIDERRKDQRA